MSLSRMASGARLVVAPSRNVCGATDIGRRRTKNEDCFHVAADGSLLVVADGLGGLPAGEVASTIAVAAAVAMLEGRAAGCPDEVVAIEMLGDVYRAADRAIHENAAREPAHRGMATTLVVAIVAGPTMYLSHVGDVRGYRLGKRGLERLTEDHTTAWELVATGILTEQEARIHPLRNALTRVLGLRERVQPSFRTVPLSSDDIVLLCSDGLWEPVAADDIAATLAASDLDLETRTQRLLDRALDAGGPDNVTAAIYQHMT